MIQYYERIGFIQTSLVTSLPVHLYQPFRYAVTSSAINARSFFATPTSNGNRNLQEPLPHAPKARTRQRFREFDLQGKVYVVTGGARGLGLSMSEALVEPGGQGK